MATVENIPAFGVTAIAICQIILLLPQHGKARSVDRRVCRTISADDVADRRRLLASNSDEDLSSSARYEGVSPFRHFCRRGRPIRRNPIHASLGTLCHCMWTKSIVQNLISLAQRGFCLGDIR